MSGFKDDVISILKTHGLPQREGGGWIVRSDKSEDGRELFFALTNKGFPVTMYPEDFMVFDYVVMDKENTTVPNLVEAMTHLHIGGILIIEGVPEYHKKYVSIFGNFTGTKVKYDNREYLVIHSGMDYGN